MPDSIIVPVLPIYNITHNISYKTDNSKPTYREYDDFTVSIYSQDYYYYVKIYEDNLPVVLNMSEISPLYENITCNVLDIRITDMYSYYEIVLNLRKVEV